MAANDVIDLKRLYLVVRRHQRLAGGILCGFVILTLLYILFATPQYRATAQLLVDKSVTQTVSDISSIKKTGFETQALESEIEIIKSQGIARTAFAILKDQGYFKDIGQNEKDIADALSQMANGLDVTRIADTYVFTITYTSDDPQKSADFANAYAQAYIQDQISVLSQISTRTITWLHTKISEINAQSADVRNKLTAYRAAYNKSQRESLETGAARETGQEQLPHEAENANDKKTSTDIGIREMEVLEQEIQTYDTLYNFYLEKLKTIGVQETFPLTETRIITQAMPSKEKSHPKALFLLAAALVFGTGTGLVLALLLDSLDATLRRAGQVRRELNLPFLGFLPERQNGHISNATFISKGGASCNFMLPDSSVAEPASLYSEVTRTIVNAADSVIGTDGKKVIGIVSSDSNGARRFVAANLASFLALSSSCLLINADLRANGGRPAQGIAGLKDILTGTNDTDEVILRLKNGNLALLESFGADLNETLAYLTPAHVKAMMESLRARFDNIIVIMPDLLMPAEAYSFAGSVDGFVIVAEWGKALPNDLNFHLAQNKLDPTKILGVVLENTDMKKMEKFYGHKTSKI